MAIRFLDTTVLLRYLANDDRDKASRSRDLLKRVESGDERVTASPMVIFETVFSLQRVAGVPRAEFREMLLPIIEFRYLQLPGKPTYRRAFELYVDYALPFADAYNLAYMEEHEVTEIYSWDRDFDRIEGISRILPPG